jgi:hypothetical protein
MSDAIMKARQLIDGASFGPEALKAIGQAFDKAWLEVAGNFGDEPGDIERAQYKLATALLSVANEDSRDVEVLKRAALERMALDYDATTDGSPPRAEAVRLGRAAPCVPSFAPEARERQQRRIAAEPQPLVSLRHGQVGCSRRRMVHAAGWHQVAPALAGCSPHPADTREKGGRLGAVYDREG